MNRETAIQNRIRLALSEAGCLIFRNEVGTFWAGKVLHKSQGQVTLGNSRPIPCGLCVGSSDLIGLMPDGRFLAVEVKTPTGKPTKEQLNFIEHVRRSGGVAGIARSPEEALELINGN